jgi:hypothetical protein
MIGTATTTKEVRFHEKSRARYTLSLNDMTDAEIESVWYSRKEFKHMRKEKKFLIKQLQRSITRSSVENDSILLEDHDAAYGLESEDSRTQGLIRTIAAFHSVLLEQKRQWDNDIQDAERIACAALTISKNSAVDARKRAVINEKFVKQDLMKELIRTRRRRRDFSRVQPQPSSPLNLPERKSCLPSSHQMGQGYYPLKSPCKERWQCSISDIPLASSLLSLPPQAPRR